MGKGYKIWDEIGGTDLKSHLEAALARKVSIVIPAIPPNANVKLIRRGSTLG
jgi:hypothetical protein